MTAKEYLSRAFYLNMRIRSKNEQIAVMNALATRVTSTLSNTPVSGTKNDHKMEDVILNILEYEKELKEAMNQLVTLKREIRDVIEQIGNDEYQVLLELRYLSSMRWEQIAVEMGYSIEHVYRLHREALKKVCVPTA
ncbi:MAG: DUF1492 domain-containing protein [Lachnospiraceae bacterium]|nr:DUF1492 domain-containing protein [Lachnospiraceae bacterium]